MMPWLSTGVLLVASTCWAEAGGGAVATQSFINPAYGILERILAQAP